MQRPSHPNPPSGQKESWAYEFGKSKKNLTCRGPHIQTQSFEDGLKENWSHEFGKSKKKTYMQRPLFPDPIAWGRPEGELSHEFAKSLKTYMQRPSYPDPIAWERPEGELRPWICYRYKNLHAEAVISGPHLLRTARRRADAMNLVKVKRTYMQRPSYPDPTAWGRPEEELRPWIW